MQNLAVALNNEIRKRIPFGNMEVQRAVDGTRKLKFERLCYIAKLYGLKLAMKRPNDEKYCFYGERAHEFVKQVAFLFVAQPSWTWFLPLGMLFFLHLMSIIGLRLTSGRLVKNLFKDKQAKQD